MARRAWSLLSLEDGDRQFAGNEGYDDVFGVQYAFTSIVPKHGKIEAGHVGVIRNNTDFLGWGTIYSVTQSLGIVERKRCPGCTHTGIKARATMTPKFRCDRCKAEFDDATIEVIDGARVFVATFGDDWTTLQKPMPVSGNPDLYVTKAAQHAIRELNFALWMERAILGTGA